MTLVSEDVNEEVWKEIYSQLNTQQRVAAASAVNQQLQIIAGPGTGKTKVLTARVAYLLLKHRVPPRNIMITTFTKSAAVEFKGRLEKLLEHTSISVKGLTMGTFHSICLEVVRKATNWGVIKIASDRDVNEIVKQMMKEPTESMSYAIKQYEKQEINAKDNDWMYKELLHTSRGGSNIRKHISNLKTKQITVEEYSKDPNHNPLLLEYYEFYCKRMKSLSLLDFDDMLVLAFDYLQKDPSLLRKIEYVLVDEFQDTTGLQYELVKLFSTSSTGSNGNKITVVGDADQSIYAFRSMRGNDSVTFDKMRSDFPDTTIVNLSVNYRSTQHILDISEKIMSQDSKRDSKSLKSSFEHNSLPVIYKKFNSNIAESSFIANQISSYLSLPNLIKGSDIAILVRSNYQTRVIETELKKKHIRYNMLKGREFWNREEVLLFIDFLRIIAYQDEVNVWLRVVQNCCEGCGPAIINKIEKSFSLEASEFDNVVYKFEYLVMNRKFKYSDKQKDEFQRVIQLFKKVIGEYSYDVNDLNNVLNVCAELKEEPSIRKIAEKKSPAEVLGNVEEIIGLIKQFEPDSDSHTTVFSDEIVEDSLLQKFLVSIKMASTASGKDDGEEDDDDNDCNKVVVSTIHAAKGLEWKIVFVPGLTENILPLNSNKVGCDVSEERRIFYVASTRAKYLLYISSFTGSGNLFGGSGGDEQEPVLVSRFISKEFLKLTTNAAEFFTSVKEVEKLYAVLNTGYALREDDYPKIKKVVESSELSSYHLAKKTAEIKDMHCNSTPIVRPFKPKYAPVNHKLVNSVKSVSGGNLASSANSLSSATGNNNDKPKRRRLGMGRPRIMK